MRELVQVFESTEFGQVRTVLIDNEPWFVGKDVTTALGYKDSVNALKLHVEIEDKVGWQITTQFGEKKTTIINESGLYALIFGSKLPSAKAFKHWVTHDVLPTIRKTGGYNKPNTVPQEWQKVNIALQDAQATAQTLVDAIAGLKPNMALAVAMATCGEYYGVDTTSIQKLLPAESKPTFLNSTQLAEKLGILTKTKRGDARTLNKRLEALGWQTKEGNKWVLSEEGMKYGEAKVFERHGHSDYHINWGIEAVHVLQGSLA